MKFSCVVKYIPFGDDAVCQARYLKSLTNHASRFLCSVLDFERPLIDDCLRCLIFKAFTGATKVSRLSKTWMEDSRLSLSLDSGQKSRLSGPHSETCH